MLVFDQLCFFNRFRLYQVRNCCSKKSPCSDVSRHCLVALEFAIMNANETKLRLVLEGTKQYTVPLFQRSYSWDKRHWKTLWDDLLDLLVSEGNKQHFLGSVVTMPAQ